LVSSPLHDRRLVWGFWIACALAAVGGVAPFVLGGGSNRISGVVFPFALAAIALGACAVFYRQGRPVTTALYFVASLAIVYGILALIAVPLRLAVVGTCPPAPARCALGLERPLTGAEDTALAFAIGMGIVAILTGFFALVMLYRRHSVIPPPTPPVRRMDPVAAGPPAETATTEAPPSKPEVAPEPAVPEPKHEPELELPAPTEELELPAPAETLELPAPAETVSMDEEAPPPAAVRRNPRRRRTSKAPRETPPAPNIDA
jgi:hypothetical protein